MSIGTGLSSVYGTQLSDVSSRDIEGVGKLRFENNGWYKWVRVDPNTTVAPVRGRFAFVHSWTTTTVEVTMDISDSTSIVAGVFVGTPAAGNYCWVQTRGPATLGSGALNASVSNGAEFTGSGGTDGTCTVRNAPAEQTAGVVINEGSRFVTLQCPE